MDLRKSADYRGPQGFGSSPTREGPSSTAHKFRIEQRSHERRPIMTAAERAAGRTTSPYSGAPYAVPGGARPATAAYGGLDSTPSGRFDDRHEELKRQIAIKEKLLHDMTADRESTRRLRYANIKQGSGSIHNTINRERPSEASLQKAQRSPVRGAASTNGFTGMRSTHYASGSGARAYDRDAGFETGMASQQQLQFAGVNQARPVFTAGGGSPLRNKPGIANSKSRSRSKGAVRVDEVGNVPFTSSYAPNRMTRSFVERSSPTRSPIKPVLVSEPSFLPPPPIGGPIEGRDRLYRERIEAMTLDNAALQRRLNGITADMQRAKLDVEGMMTKLRAMEHKNDAVHRSVGNRDETDMSNQVLQDELDRRRDENRRLQDRIAEEQGANVMTHNRLDSTNMQKQNLQFESSNLGADLRKKACIIEDLSRELLSIQSKINMGNIELDNLNRDDIIINKEIIDISSIIGRIQAERQDAAARVHEITLTLDELLQNNESDRHQLELKRRWQSKLVTSRILEQMLMKLSNTRVNAAYQELREYAKFDRNCHNKLKAFAKVAHRLGLHKLRGAINRWYDTSLKPLAQISQNQDIALMGECNRLQAKTFYAWRKYIQGHQDRVKFKAAGCDRLWAILVRNSKLKKKRAVAIWKEGQLSVDQRMNRLRQAVRKVHEKSIRRAFSHWIGYSENLEQAVRMRVQHIAAAQRLLLSQTFHQLKLAVHVERTMRHRKLRHTVKAWRAHVRYNRHLMLVNMSAIQFVRSNQRYVMKNCFDALRHNKEVRKHKLLDHAVQNEVNPAIATLEKFSFDKSQQILRTNTIRACNAIKDQLSRRIHTYFMKWMKESGHYKLAIRTAALARIRRNYQNQLLWGLDRWRKQLLKRETQLRQAINFRLGGEVDKNSTVAHTQEADLRFREECLRTAKRRLLEKIMRKFQERRLQVAIGRWMDICNYRTTQEDQLHKVIMRQRKRQLRAAIDYYVEFLKWSRQHDKNMNGMLYLRHKANAKLMQKVFNGLVWYTQRNKRAHRYWTMILNRMDCFLRKRAVAIWRENAGLSYEKELARIQDQQTDAILKRNQLICSMEKHSSEQEDYILAQQKLRRNKGYRQLGNYFVRTMQNRLLEKFRHWRQLVLDQKHKELVIKKTLDHWRRHTFHMAAMMFKKFVNKCHAEIYNDEIRKKRQEQEMLNHNILFEKQNHDENVEAAKGTLQALEEDISLRKNRAAKLMFILERRNREWDFISRRRRIFNEWRKEAQKQKGFCTALENLLQKQLFMKGFHYIKNAAKTVHYETRIHRNLRLYALKRQKFNLTDAFNKWKVWSLNTVDDRSNAAILMLRARNQEHQDYVKLVKRTNMARVFSFLQDRNLANVWHAWRNVIKQLKQLKINQREFQERQARMQKINVINKWYLRKCATLKARAHEDTLRRILQYRKMRQTFKALKKHCHVEKSLNLGNHRLERFMRQKIFQDAMKNIVSYATSKKLVNVNKKSLGVQKIIEAIRYHYGSDLEHGWQQYKNQVFKHRRQKDLLRRVVNYFFTWRKRMAFMRWREQDNKMALCDDNYFIGPVRADQWEASREIENLKAFMRYEQFDENHIQEVVNKVEKGSHDLMLKYASRMRIRRDKEKRILPWFFDRWKKFCALRKLYRHIFRQCYNRQNNVKAILQYSFNRWKDKPLHLRSQLEKLSTPMLKEISLLTTKKIEQCSDQLYENQSISNHLMVQRDEFLNYYIKSQILAMALVKDRARNTEMQAWGRWFDKRRAMNKLDLMREIRDAAYLHANLKAREAELTQKNSELKNENVELIVFRDDAAVVRNNKIKLQSSNDDIRFKIRETDDDYARLLQENERLKKLVTEIEIRTRTTKNRKYQDLYFVKYHDEKDQEEVENQKPPGERKDHLFVTKKDQKQYETEQERKNKERFEQLAQKLAGASIR